MTRREIGRDLKRRRISAGVTVTDAARLARTTRQTLYQWEAGRSVPPADTYLRLLEIYDTEARLEDETLGDPAS